VAALFALALPVLALSWLCVAAFSFVHYWALRKRYLRGQTERVFDPRGAFRRLLSFSGLAGLALVGAFALCLAWPAAVWIVAPAVIAVFYWIGMCQALIYLGFVVDLSRRKLVFAPNLQNCQLSEYFLVYPIIVRLASADEIDLDSVEELTRQARRYVLIHGQFGSRRVGFSDKLKRDECVHLIRRHTGGRIRRFIDLD
jgi:hypothetical protein